MKTLISIIVSFFVTHYATKNQLSTLNTMENGFVYYGLLICLMLVMFVIFNITMYLCLKVLDDPWN